jgi:hypothetical protein
LIPVPALRKVLLRYKPDLVVVGSRAAEFLPPVKALAQPAIESFCGILPSLRVIAYNTITDDHDHDPSPRIAQPVALVSIPKLPGPEGKREIERTVGRIIDRMSRISQLREN